MASILKVDTIQDQSGNNIINENADTITIGASGDTITIPSGATLTNSGTATGFGKVLQVVQGTTTTQTSITSSTWTDSTLTASITPSSATNKILVLVNQHFNVFRSGFAYAGGSLRLVRGATTIYAGDVNFQVYSEAGGSTAINFYNYQPLNYLDSPSSTSALTYKTQQRSYDPGDRAMTQASSAESTIILIEIEG